MRVTQNIVYQNYLNDIMRKQESLYKLHLQLSTGKMLNAPSDDPTKVSRVLNSRSLLSDIDQYGKNIDSGLSYLSMAEDKLQSVKDVLSSIQEIAVSESTGTSDAQSRQNSAAAVSSFFNQLVNLGNAYDGNNYIFSGYETQTAAFDSTGVYQGDANKFSIKINSTTTVAIGINGGEVFKGTAGGVDIYQTVTDLITALNADDVDGVRTALDNLEQSYSQVSNTVADIGGKVSWLQSAQAEYSSTKLEVQSTISNAEDADITRVISEMQMGQTALQAAMASAAKTFDINIFDYI